MGHFAIYYMLTAREVAHPDAHHTLKKSWTLFSSSVYIAVSWFLGQIIIVLQ